MTKSIQSNKEYEAKWYQKGYEKGWKDRDSDYQDVGVDTPLEAYKDELKKRIEGLKAPFDLTDFEKGCYSVAIDDCLKLLEGGE